ncbi:MAG: RNA 2',3'-cyclic phosphodiesterase [bacterium]
METIRTFIAVPVGEEVERAVETVESALKRSAADVKWVRPGNVHITLKFLGSVESGRIGDIARGLAAALDGARGFDATVSGVGTFPPNPRRARVVYMGLKEGAAGMAGLAERVEDAMAGLGFEKEKRPFKSHLTIGRVRRGARRLEDLGKAIAGAEYKPLKLSVDRVNLVKSELTPSGAIYTIIETFGLER